jgi:hypothetical protein
LEIVSVILFFTQHHPTFPFDFFCCFCHVLYFAFSNPQMLWIAVLSSVGELRTALRRDKNVGAGKDVKTSPHINIC